MKQAMKENINNERYVRKKERKIWNRHHKNTKKEKKGKKEVDCLLKKQEKKRRRKQQWTSEIKRKVKQVENDVL